MRKNKWLSVGLSAVVFLLVLGGCTIVPVKKTVDRELLNSIVQGEYDDAQPKPTEKAERPESKSDENAKLPKQNEKAKGGNEETATEDYEEAFTEALDGVLGLFDLFGAEEGESNGYNDQPTDNIEEEKAMPRTGISPEFKAFMDEYEEFYYEYIDYLVKYENSDDVMGMLADYIQFMEQLSDYEDALDEIDEDELTDAELLYMTEVTLRIEQKMLEALG